MKECSRRRRFCCLMFVVARRTIANIKSNQNHALCCAVRVGVFVYVFVVRENAERAPNSNGVCGFAGTGLRCL